ncbi:MAG: dockerin type I domain-containing protein [Aeoliella sp.]
MPRLLVILSTIGVLLSGSAARGHIVIGTEELDMVGHRAPFGLASGEEYTDVWGDGSFAYLGSVGSGVALMELSAVPPEPNEPTQFSVAHLGTYAPPGHVDFQDVKVVGDTGYFSGGAGTDIVDLSNRAAPTTLARIDASNGGHAVTANVALAGDYLYQVSNTSAIIRVFDVASPSAPTFVQNIDTADPVGLADLTFTGDRLYAAGIGGGTYVYDLSGSATNPPPLLSTVLTGVNTSSVWTTPDGELLIATHRELGGELEAWDISLLATPSLLQTADPSDFDFSAYSTSEVVVVESLAYVAWYQGGLEVIDLDRIDTVGLELSGYFDVGGGNPLSEFTGVRSVYPHLGPEQVLLSNTRFGMYVVDATPAQPSAPGDYTGDGEVDLLDYDLWKQDFGTTLAAADGNGDGAVDSADYTVWRDAMQVAAGAIASSTGVPEPTGGVFSIIGLICCAWSYRSRRSQSKLE